MTVMLEGDDLDDVRRLRDIREQAGTLRKEETAIRERLLTRLGDEDFAITASGAPALSIQHQVRRQINSRKLEALHPEVYDAVVEEKSVTVLKVDLEEGVFPDPFEDDEPGAESF